MEFPRLATPPSVSVHDFSDVHVRRPSTTHTSPLTLSSRQAASPQRPTLSIPASKDVPGCAPPPLPPPSRISDLDNGHDTAWLHANSNPNLPVSSAYRLPPVSPCSSLSGTQCLSEPDPMNLDEPAPAFPRSGRPYSRSFDGHIRVEPPTPVNRPLRNSLSVSTNFPPNFPPPL